MSHVSGRSFEEVARSESSASFLDNFAREIEWVDRLQEAGIETGVETGRQGASVPIDERAHRYHGNPGPFSISSRPSL
jgi:hypothetical protein